jgi:hypothetical protein
MSSAGIAVPQSAGCGVASLSASMLQEDAVARFMARTAQPDRISVRGEPPPISGKAPARILISAW